LENKQRRLERGIMPESVIVSGIGVISSIGHRINEFSLGLREGRSGIGWLKPSSGPSISVKIGAEVRDFDFKSQLRQNWQYPLGEGILEKADQCARRSPFPVQASVLSALQAWEGAQLHRQKIPSHRLGLVVAGHNLNQHDSFELYQKVQQAPEYLNPRTALHFMDTDHIGTLSEIFEIQGEGFTVGGASASGNVGILKGYQLVQWGIAEACMVVGGLSHLSPLELQAFYNLGAMGGKRFQNEPGKACRPFDKDHEGFIYGQGSGCLILESSESSRNRKVPPLAEILGGSLVLDGNQLSNPGENGEVRAMTSALQQANLKPEQIHYLNAHGTSSPLGDKTEIKAVKRVFRECLSQLWINSSKSLTGHCLSSAGVIECIASIIQMQEGFIHPNINLENPIDNECRFSRHKAEIVSIDTAMSNSFGFGGINSSIILRKRV
jgi:malonyl-ACP decarboxylase